ncbi:MAG: hypothetical protein HFG40_02605 [Bacilli bacterium]|nr:hypothetical protein [Bacilli bacterium]
MNDSVLLGGIVIKNRQLEFYTFYNSNGEDLEQLVVEAFLNFLNDDGVMNDH